MGEVLMITFKPTPRGAIIQSNREADNVKVKVKALSLVISRRDKGQ